MAVDDGTSGTVLEGLLIGDPQAVELATLFSNKDLKLIISPTVNGFLRGLSSKADFANFNIAGCSIDYLSEFTTKESNESENQSGINSALVKEFAQAAETFVKKVSEVRAPYIPPDLNNTTLRFNSAGISQSKMESYENAFMRMLGMPSDSDLKTSQYSNGADTSVQLFYFSPDKTNDGKLIKSKATLGQITGADGSGSDFSHILAERRKVVDKENSEKRIFNFAEVVDNDIQLSEKIEIAKRLMKEAEGTPPEAPGDSSKITEAERLIAYHIPDQLFRFYYLKSTPIQDSSVYGCIIDSSKIIAKPFDNSSYQKINGIKPKTSLLETIIRIRLDRITGDPGIYAYDSEDPNSAVSGITLTPQNVDQDRITEVECFLIQKLKRILYLLGEKYIEDIAAKQELYLKKKNEVGSKSGTPKPPPGPDNKAVVDESPYSPRLQQLEILKAKEDAVLFLLKDTSSSYAKGGYSSQYSSLDIQEGIIRTSSGFNDILSGPLYSLLSHRSEQLDKAIKEGRQSLDSASAKNDNKSGKTMARGVDEKGFSSNPEDGSYTYHGICSEDFIVYSLALFIIEQDYLIGLLPYENRKNLANTISNSIINTGGKNKDPYGVLERLNKSPQEGGFPSVVDSVNALGILVATIYEEYIDYIKNQNLGLVEKIKSAIAAARQSGSE